MRTSWKNLAVLLPFCAALFATGCANVGQKLVKSESPLDFIMAVAGHEHVEYLPVEKRCTGSGRVATAHAHADSKGVYVYGSIEKGFSPGWITSAWAHIDVVAFDGSGRRVESATTSFTPSTVPATQRSIVGRSTFFVRLGEVSSSATKVEVAIHQIPLKECEFGRPSESS